MLNTCRCYYGNTPNAIHRSYSPLYDWSCSIRKIHFNIFIITRIYDSKDINRNATHLSMSQLNFLAPPGMSMLAEHRMRNNSACMQLPLTRRVAHITSNQHTGLESDIGGHDTSKSMSSAHSCMHFLVYPCVTYVGYKLQLLYFKVCRLLIC